MARGKREVLGTQSQGLVYVLVIGTPERIPCGKKIGSYTRIIPSGDSSAGRQGVPSSPSSPIDRPIAPGQAQAGDAFATPTIVHFGTVLLLSAILSGPWHGIGTAALLWGLVGLSGIVYDIIVAWRMRVRSAMTSPSSISRLFR